MHSKKDKNIEKLKKQISKLETKYELIKADLYYTDIRAMNRHQAHRIYKSLMENLKNRRKLYQNYQPSISEYLESKKFVSKNKKKIISKINLYTNANFTEEELIEAELNNFINNEKRNEIIESVCETLLNEKMTEIEYHNLLIILGINIKNKIIFETYNYPEKFIPLKEAEKANPNTTLFMEGILSKLLISNKVTVAIRKDNQNESDKIALSLLSAISTGEAFKKIITLTYNIDEKKTLYY